MTPRTCIGYRFDAFEVQLGTDTLLRNGYDVHIQQLPFQTLVFLLERAGETVTREELRQRLWSDRTFIEFDNNLRVAVTKLREALGEQAVEPRYIKTLSRKGYQFIGNVAPVYADPVVHSAASQTQTSGVSFQENFPGEAVGVIARPFTRRLWWPATALAVTALCGLVAAGFTRWYVQRPLASDRDKIALGGVANESGDATFDGVLTTVFRLKLQESPYLSTVREQDFGRLVGQRDEAAPLASQLSACRSLGAAFLLNGRLVARNPGYLIEIGILRCGDGRRMAKETAKAKTESEVLSALNQAIEETRRRLGESENSLEKYNAPLTQATTSSFVALKAFTLGSQKHRDGQEAQSISNYKLAVDLDPQFAMAHARLGTAYLNIGEYTEARSSYEMAFKLRERTTDRERLYIAAHYYYTVMGEIPRAIEVYQLWQTVYPRDVVPVDNLANAYLSIGAADKALQAAKLAVELDPRSPPSYAILARAYLASGDYAELNRLCNNPQRIKTEVILFHSACYLSAFVQNDVSTEQRELLWAHENPQESILLEYQAWTQIYRGKLVEGRQTFAYARESARKQHLTDFAAELELDEAGLDADMGERTEARKHARAALQQAPVSNFVHAFSALVFANTGDVEGARKEAAEAAKEAPLDSIQRNTLLASTRASLQLQQHDAKGSIQSMEEVRPFDNIGYMSLSPAYYRGMALLVDRQYDGASRAFQQVIDHRALYPQSVYIVLSQLQLAHTLELSGHTSEARIQYEQLRNLWRDADRDFPPLQQLEIWSKSLR